MEVNTKSSEKAHFIKDNIDEFLKKELFPRLEALFEKYGLSENIIRFENLNINLNIDKWENSNAIFIELEKQLSEKLKVNTEQINVEEKIHGNEAVKIVSPQKSNEEVFLFFLRHGYLPWFGTKKQVTEFTSAENWRLVLYDKPLIKNLITLLKSEEQVTERFLYQFSNRVVFEFLVRTLPAISEKKKQWIRFLDSLQNKTRNECLKFLVLVSCNPGEKILIPVFISACKLLEQEKSSFKISDEREIKHISHFQHLVNEFLTDYQFNKLIAKYRFQKEFSHAEPEKVMENLNSKKTGDPEKEVTNTEEKVHEKTEQELSENGLKTSDIEDEFFNGLTKEIHVLNAGLVLLHPFIKSFFENIEVLSRDGTIQADNRFLAIQALHYLATGNEDFFEGSLILEKYFCDIPLKIPVPERSLITKKVREESTFLLQETIKNWPALKNTSPDGLRQLFIYRDGKLIQKEKRYKLIVERKAQDVLLEKLPWNISVVKLPWKKELLFVEW